MAFAAFISTSAISNEASAKQCVYSEAGYVAKVRWYKPSQLTYNKKTRKVTGGKPVQTNNLSLFRTVCTDSIEPLTAVISVVGGKYVVKGVVWGSSAVLTVAGAAGAGAACVGSAGAACPAAFAGIVAAGTTTFAFLGDLADDPKEVFYVGTPSSYRELKLWGTVFSPQASSKKGAKI